MQKKFQIFISSTFRDLKKERQAAVEAILSSKHIPAGMELFNSGDESQLQVIKRWIEESDIYLLILGGRYGSIEPISNISYTELEYNYAEQLGKPIFAVVANQAALHRKAGNDNIDVFESENKDKYEKFKARVEKKMCKYYDDEKDIKLSIHETMTDFRDRYNLSGWISSNDIPDTRELIEEIEKHKAYIKQLKIELNEKHKLINIEHSKENSNDDIVTEMDSFDYEERLNVIFELEKMVKINSKTIYWIEGNNKRKEFKINPPNDTFDYYYHYSSKSDKEFDQIRFIGLNDYYSTRELLNTVRLFLEKLPDESTITFEFILVYQTITNKEYDKVIKYLNNLKSIFGGKCAIEMIVWDIKKIKEIEDSHLIFN